MKKVTKLFVLSNYIKNALDSRLIELINRVGVIKIFN